MARIGKRAGKASMMRIGKKSLEMLPDDPNLSLATFARDERGGNVGRSWKTNFGQKWPNLSRFVRFYRTERGSGPRRNKGRSAFMRLGKRINNKAEEQPGVEMMSQKKDPEPETILQKRDPEMVLQKRNPKIILQKRDPDQVDQEDEFDDSRRCLEEKICNVVFNRNGMTYRIFYRQN